MRVISGRAKHITLISSNGAEMQPTIDRVKEAVFSKLQFIIPGSRVLDLFAGSGQLGLEALSRGAEFCDFVDSSRDSINAVKKNIERCGFKENCAVHATDAFKFLKEAKINNPADGAYRIIFLDPPFHKNMIGTTLPLVERLCGYDTVVYCETFYDEAPAQSCGRLAVSDVALYGRIRTTFYRLTQ